MLVLKLLITAGSFGGFPLVFTAVPLKLLPEDKVAFGWRLLALIVSLGIAEVLFIWLYDILWF